MEGRSGMPALRDHPLMIRRGVHNWPPIWTKGALQETKSVTGEVGVLRYIHSNDASNRCFLIAENDRELYTGTLIFDDVKFCRQIVDLLRKQVGRPIKEIGDLDIQI
jgi:hypothetical protein